MRTTLLTALLLMLLAGCNKTAQETNTTDDTKYQPDSTIAPADTTPKVVGVGGIFFFSDDPEATKAWYGKNLGIDINDFGSIFEGRDINRPDQVTQLVWSPFPSNTDYFAPSKKDFMINYRVQHLEALVEKLRANGVTVVDTLETYDFGKFIHILDPEGNKVELWEPMQ